MKRNSIPTTVDVCWIGRTAYELQPGQYAGPHCYIRPVHQGGQYKCFVTIFPAAPVKFYSPRVAQTFGSLQEAIATELGIAV